MINYVPNFDDTDPAMRFEGLARYAFDCDAYGDPDGYAHQSTYNFYFIPEITEEGIEILNKILNALIDKCSTEKKSEFQQIKDSLTEKMEQMTGIHLIDYLISIIRK